MAIRHDREQLDSELEALTVFDSGQAESDELHQAEVDGKDDLVSGIYPPELAPHYSAELRFSIHQARAEKAKRIRQLTSSDLVEIDPSQRRSWIRRGLAAITVSAALGSLAFEQSPGNEAMRAAAGLNVLERTGNELVVGGTVAAITMGIEGGSSALIALGLHQEKDTVRRLVKRFKKKSKPGKDDGLEPTPTNKKVDKVTDMGIALGVGAGFVVTKRHLSDEEPTLQRDMTTALKASALVAGFSGAVGTLAAGGIEHADKVGLGTPAEYFVDYATDWKFWLAVVGVAQGAVWLKSKIKRGDNPAVLPVPFTNTEKAVKT